MIYESRDQSIPAETEAYDEAVASQEEIYLEEIEEELRAILIFGGPSPSEREVWRTMSGVNHATPITVSLDEQLNHTVEELITGDSDDPPLSQQAVAEMLDDSHALRLTCVSEGQRDDQA